MLLAVLLSCKNIKRLVGADTPRNPEVPPAPGPLAMPKGPPQQQAAGLVDALEDPKRRLAAWMRIYEALEVPVYDVTDKALSRVAPETPGPYFWTVWLASGLEKKSTGVRFLDAGGILTLGLSGVDARAVSEALLADLRENASRSSAPSKLLAAIVRERVLRGPSRADLSDAKVGTEAVIDLPTLHLLSWLVFRGVLARVQPNGKSGWLEPAPHTVPSETFGAGWTGWSLVPEAHAAGSGFKCSELLGNERVTSWVKNVLKFAGGGGTLAFADGSKASMPKTSELVAKAFGAGSSTAKGVGSLTSYANMVSSALSLYMTINFLALRVQSEPPILERTKKKGRDGKEQVHSLQVITDTGGKVDGDNLAACATSFGLNALGVSFKLPEDGKALPGVEVQFKPGKGFDRVMWGDYRQIRQVADSNGELQLKILGRSQKVDIPEDAKEDERDYSFFAESQPEKADAGSIANMFWSSLKAVAGKKGSGFVSPILQQAKFMHYSLGEQTFALIDWKPAGWTVTGQQQEAVFSGTVCDITKEFRIKLGGTMNGHLVFHPSKQDPNAGGRFDYSGAFADGTLWGNGTYTMSGDPWTSLTLHHEGSGCVNYGTGKNCSDTHGEMKFTVAKRCP
ncbi:MAG: hypothetical protein R3B13_32475 [Polyangiaceae bacterium]